MVHTGWNPLRLLNRQNRANEEAENLASSPLSEMKADDGNDRNSSSDCSGQKTDFVGDAQSWTTLTLQGIKPEPRYNHAATIIGKKMVVVGGESSHGLLDDVQVLHMGKLSWSAVGPTTQAPTKEALSRAIPSQRFPACKGHSLVSWGKTVILIGGQMEPPSDRVEVWAFNTKTENWSRIEAKGDIPVARSGQSVTKAGSLLIMFGGEDAKGRKLKDLYMFDLKSLMWIHLQTTGAEPSPRSKHIAAIYNDRFLLIFGGASKRKALNDLFSLDFETMEWSKIKTQGFMPSPRSGCCGVLLGDKWYIVGGEGRKTRCSETLIFDVAKMTWFYAVTAPSSSVVSNQGFSVVLIQRKEGTFFVAFGGYNKELSNEVEVLMSTLPEAALQSSAVTPKKSLQGEGLLKHTQEHTPHGLAPRVASRTFPCSCISVAKHHLTSAADHRSSSRNSLREVSVVGHAADVAGIIPLRKLFQHEEELAAEPAVHRNSNRSENELVDQSPIESMSVQSSKYFERVEGSRLTSEVLSGPVACSEVSSELENLASMQRKEDERRQTRKKKTVWQVSCQNDEGLEVPCPSGKCGQLSGEVLLSNRSELCRRSGTDDFSLECNDEVISVISPGNGVESMSDLADQNEIKLAPTLKKDDIARHKLSPAEIDRQMAEESLSASMKGRQNYKVTLVEAIREIEFWKEKALAAELAQEEASDLSNIVHAENVRLEHDLAFLKAVLEDTQKELHTTRGFLQADRKRAFQLQVEVFQLRQKLQSAECRASTPKRTQ